MDTDELNGLMDKHLLASPSQSAVYFLFSKDAETLDSLQYDNSKSVIDFGHLMFLSGLEPTDENIFSLITHLLHSREVGELENFI